MGFSIVSNFNNLKRKNILTKKPIKFDDNKLALVATFKGSFASKCGWVPDLI